MIEAPEPAVITGSREQLLHLLAEASEIEHTLMCSYLYAAFSLKRFDEGLTVEQGRAVTRWRKAIAGVATEEMGHLLMVTNLTVAIGGAPHFARPNFPVSPGYFPSGVVVRLSGFSEQTLEHFIFLERPRGVDGEDASSFEQDDYDRSQAHHGLMPSAQDYETIGHLYEAIRQNLKRLASDLGEAALFVGPRQSQVGPELSRVVGCETIGSLAEALTTIDTIVEQGEGSPRDRDESHYRTFSAILDELRMLKLTSPDFQPAWPVADNPVLRQPPEPEDKVFIKEPEAAKMLDFSCASYGLLLRVLSQAFSRSGCQSHEQQRDMMALAIALMHVVSAASNALARLPANSEVMGMNAGMSFTMLRGVEPLPFGPIETRILREQISALISKVPPSAELVGSIDRLAQMRDLAILRSAV